MSATSSSSVQTGWAAGAGAEYIVADNWSVKGEYLYTALNSMSANGTAVGNSSCCGGSSSSASGASTVNISMGTFGIHQARVGLNYHTNWLGGINSIPIR